MRFAGSDQQLRHADHVRHAGLFERGIGMDDDAIAGGERLARGRDDARRNQRVARLAVDDESPVPSRRHEHVEHAVDRGHADFGEREDGDAGGTRFVDIRASWRNRQVRGRRGWSDFAAGTLPCAPPNSRSTRHADPTRAAARPPDPVRDRDFRRPRAMGGHLPARALPRVRAWRTKGLLAFAGVHGDLVLSAVPLGGVAGAVPALRPDDPGHPGRRGHRRTRLRGRRLGLASQPARFEHCCGAIRTSGTTAPSAWIPGARSGSARSTWWAGRRSSAWRSTLVGLSPHGGFRDGVRRPRSCRCSSTPTCARRAGWACSCSARRAIPGTTRAACTPATTPTCRCSTSC